MKSINPYNNILIAEYPEHTLAQAGEIIDQVHAAWLEWKNTSFEHRSSCLRNAAQVLRNKKDEFATLITSEMGKIISESLAEVEKCAVACDFYAENGAGMLRDEEITSDASRSYVTFEPLGVVLAVMPWNFPFWQVFRFAVPALMAGNAGVLKHASNVGGCALAIESIFSEAGFPPNLFRTLLIPSGMVKEIIENPGIAAVTLTGSELAGSQVASAAGRLIKKTVLELGGSDPFIVLEDADLEKAVATAITARMINQGQSCIAAKRVIVVEEIADKFEYLLKKEMAKLRPGDPMDPETQTGPLARPDLVEEADRQVSESVLLGATVVLGGYRDTGMQGCIYPPTIISNVRAGMPVYSEETFGPVVAVIRVKDEWEAIAVANDTEFGLGGSVWTKNLQRGDAVARRIETGAVFVNGLVKSDPRLPFGGIKKSGYGRELSSFGIREFVNIKTVWISL
jgi:succinate-semialdehyde dehydrogenase / glutarate-semialdehyde dehydrogenase